MTSQDGLLKALKDAQGATPAQAQKLDEIDKTLERIWNLLQAIEDRLETVRP